MKTPKTQTHTPNYCQCAIDSYGRKTMCAAHSGRLAEPKHTPTPWKVKGNLNTIEGANGLTVCDLRSNTVDADADAAFIVRAVNAHEELVNHLKVWMSRVKATDRETLSLMEASLRVIDRAEGREIQ